MSRLAISERKLASEKRSATPSSPTCSMCSRTERDLDKALELDLMIKGATGHICASCVDVASELVADYRKEHSKNG